MLTQVTSGASGALFEVSTVDGVAKTAAGRVPVFRPTG